MTQVSKEFINGLELQYGERSGSVLDRDRGAADSGLIGVTALCP